MVSIAQDLQGPDAPRPWLQKAGATFMTLLDRHNVVGRAYNLKYVPVGILLDEEGRLVRTVGPVDINDDAFAAEIDAWASGCVPPKVWSAGPTAASLQPPTVAEAGADALFQEAVALLGREERMQAKERLRRAVALDSQNWLIRKQLWALEAPEAFYGEAVDYAWQKRRTAEEDARLAAAGAAE